MFAWARPCCHEGSRSYLDAQSDDIGLVTRWLLPKHLVDERDGN
jgi:hypothetical protein